MEEKINPDKAILAGLDAAVFSREETATESTLEELKALLETAGGTAVGMLLQARPAPDPHSFLGEGKVEELRQAVEATGANMVIFDNDLSPSQIRTLEDMTGATVIDRSALILDIFAQRAKTREGRLQVELAQYQYLLPRLSGMGRSLSRQGGGIGTRGPGETRLESDRRHIRTRISRLQQELKEVRRVRGVQRQLREKNSVPVVALIGYTNAGKSTLLNALTGAGIPANNRLFDTLDTTTRRLTVSDTLDVLLSDTVGFIAKLPHNLVEAFQATLEELQYADLLLHVIDASDPDREAHMEVVEKLAAELAPQGVPIIEVYNKADLVEPQLIPIGENRVAISASAGRGLDALLRLMEKNLDTGVKRVVLKLPYSAAGEVDRIHREGKVFSSEYENDGILVDAALSREMQGRYRAYIQSE
ncbi:MAG: GTPase HflX [Oscillospiraceae bacterium]|nr:GTPase HflX [Oscillospiraceae bacterium]